jgi:uncharacterized protein (TIGR02246 family)
MNTLLAFTVAGLLSTPTSAAAHPQTPPPPPRTCPPVSTSEIEAQFTRFTSAWATGDADAVTDLFSADPVLLATVSNIPRTTPSAVRDYFMMFLANKPAARIDTSTVEIDCETASRVGTWTVTLTDPATRTVREVPARYTFIYRHGDGGWKIEHLHSSMMPEPVQPLITP